MPISLNIIDNTIQYGINSSHSMFVWTVARRHTHTIHAVVQGCQGGELQFDHISFTAAACVAGATAASCALILAASVLMLLHEPEGLPH